jgi:glycosyltransferase involved in cell wall biosynthesis
MCASGVRRVTFVLGTSAGGTGAHVRMLAAGLARRGAGVRVAGPAQTAGDLGLDTIPGVGFTAVDFGDRPRPADATAILALRRLLTAAGTRPDVVHAHGMRAGALTAIALVGASTAGNRAPRLAVTVHNAPPPGGGAARLVYLALERVVARRADLVLAVSADLEQRMRKAGARDVARAVVPAPARPAPQEPEPQQPAPQPPAPEDGRPLILAVGRLAPQKGFATLLEAAAAWQDLTPRPRLLIAGDGPLKAELEAKAKELMVDAEFPGHRSDIPELLATARVFVLPSLWEGQPLALQEALRAGVPIVASDAGGIPGLTGNDAALLVGPDNAERLGEAVISVLENDDLAARLRAAARRRAAALPAEDDAVTAVLAAYSRACE